MNIDEKVKEFAKIVQAQALDHLIKLCGSTKGNEKSYLADIVPRKKYILVNIGNSGVYVIEKATEQIFGCKGYGVIHRGKCYGSLDEILGQGRCGRN